LGTFIALTAAAMPQPTSRNQAEVEWEMVRISRPDGTVVTLRVPKHVPLQLARHHTAPRAVLAEGPHAFAEDSPHAFSRGTHGRHAVSGAAPSRTSSEGPGAAAPSGRVVSRYSISHPLHGRSSGEGPVRFAPTGQGRTGLVSPDPIVAGDEPGSWLTGRGWKPGNELDNMGGYLSEEPEEIIRLEAGTEFSGDTEPPPAMGERGDPGYDAEVIARWDVVPHQTIVGDFAVGLLAFHMNGISRIDISLEGGPWKRLMAMQDNPQTGVREYVAMISRDDMKLAQGEEIELRAIAYPAGAGKPRLLPPLFLYVNNDGYYRTERVYVAASGNDSTGEGTLVKPFKTIQKALNKCRSDIDKYEGADIIVLERGRYDIDQPAGPVLNDRWITIRRGSNLSRDDVVIAAGGSSELVRPNTRRLRFYGVSLDFSDMYQMYKEDPHLHWYDNARWFYGKGWTFEPNGSISPVRNVGYTGVYATDSLAEDMLYGFVNLNLVRGCHVEKITGDAFQNSLMVVQSTVHNLNGTLLAHHADLLQYFGQMENLLVYNVSASLVIGAQNIFLSSGNSTFTNCAFVNVAVQNAESDPPFSQLGVPHDHVLFYHVSNPGQRFVLRDDGGFTGKDVIFRNCVAERIQSADYFGPLPEGVLVDHCHFNYNQPIGEDPTTGAIAILNSNGGYFEYKGPGAGRISGSAALIPGYSDSSKPDRGARPWSARPQ
jgi:hypothetical protein